MNYKRIMTMCAAWFVLGLVGFYAGRSSVSTNELQYKIDYLSNHIVEVEQELATCKEQAKYQHPETEGLSLTGLFEKEVELQEKKVDLIKTVEEIDDWILMVRKEKEKKHCEKVDNFYDRCKDGFQ